MKIFRFHFLLIIIVIITTSLLLINPEILHDNSDYFRTEYIRYLTSSNQQACSFLPDDPDYDVVIASTDKNILLVQYRNLENNAGSYHELPGYSLNQILSSSNIYFDQEKGKCLLIPSKNGGDYYFCQLANPGSLNRVKLTRFYHHDLYDQLQDTVITVNQVKFYDMQIDSQLSSDFELTDYYDGYSLKINSDYLGNLRSVRITNVETDSTYQSLSDNIAEIVGRRITSEEIYRVTQFFLRNSYYQQILFSRDDIATKGFLGANIVGTIDADGDGVREYLILISGKRWICDRLLCYNPQENRILWEREFIYGTTAEYYVQDIDADGREEILFSTTAYCNEFPIDWIQKQEVGKSYISYFYVLDAMGENKKINGRDLLYESEPGMNKIKFLPLFEQNKVLIGLISHNAYKQRNLLLYDLTENRLDTLQITFYNASGFYRDNENIIMLDNHNNILEQIAISPDFQKADTKQKKVNHFYTMSNENKVMIEETEYLILHPFTIADQNLNFLYKGLQSIQLNSAIWKDNKVFFSQKEDYISHLASIEFTRNHKLNPYLIAIIAAEMLLILLYLSIRQTLKIPIRSARGNFFLEYLILGRLYYMKLIGSLNKIYKLPRKYALSSETPSRILHEIAEEYDLIYHKNYLVLQINVYEIKSSDEFMIIQRISHDLKNQVLSLKLFTENNDQAENKQSNEYLKEMNYMIKNISSAAITLSNFSHISKPYLEPVLLSEIIDRAISSYANHIFFDLLQLRNSTNCQITLKLDKNLFLIALKNLLDNAFEAIDKNGYVRVIIKQQADIIQISIHNPFIFKSINIQKFANIGYTTKESGSGIGIPIARKIIEKHGGLLEYLLADNEIIASISLPTDKNSLAKKQR